MGYASETLADKRHKTAELEHLREFYLFWAQMHAVCGEQDSTMTAKQEAAQQVVDQAKKLRTFYE